MVAMSMTAWAAPGYAGPHVPVLLVQTATISSDEAARRAKEEYGGRVLSVDLVDQPGESAYYRVKLISGGTVRVVRIAAVP